MEGLIGAVDHFGEVHEVSPVDLSPRKSVYGIFIKDGQILLHQIPGTQLWTLPGGEIEEGESIDKALIREFEEESGLAVVVIDQSIVINNIYYDLTHNRAYNAELTLCRVAPTGGKLIESGNGSDTLRVRYVELDQLTQDTIVPVFWQTILELQHATKL